MAQNDLRRRASLLGDLRIIVLGTLAFFLQLVRSFRLTPKLLDQHDDAQQP